MLKISVFIIITILTGCGTVQDYSSNVSIYKKHDSFTYSLTGQGYSNEMSECRSEAEKNVFEVLLFRGLSGTDLQVPLVENEKVSVDNNKKFYEDFFDKKKYRNFISSSVEFVENPKPIKDGYGCTVRFTVNLNSLKNNLEQNGIIRKFGL